MAKRGRIDVEEAHRLGLTHVRPGQYVTASVSRRSIVVETPEPTGFTWNHGGWHVTLYDSHMAGAFARRTGCVPIPYDIWLAQPENRVPQTQGDITD